MGTHAILGGKVQLYRRGDARIWHCSTSVGGQQRRSTTKEEDLALAKEAAEDWYLELRGKSRAGLLKPKEKTVAQAATQFLNEYQVITEGERSVRWTEGHGIRLRVHLLPFFGPLGLSEVTPGKVQDYRVHRMTSHLEPNPHSRSNRPITGKPPARSTLHNEIVTLRQVLKTAIRQGWLAHLPDLSPPYRTQGKIVHRPWFSPAEYRQLYEATRAYARQPFHDHYKWNAEQVHDYVLFLANTGLRPDEAGNLEHRDVAIVEDESTGERILEIEVRGKLGLQAVRLIIDKTGPRPAPDQHAAFLHVDEESLAGSAGAFEPVSITGYYGDRGYAFLRRADGDEAFVHIRTLRLGGVANLAVGDDLTARIAIGPKGLVAVAAAPLL